MYKTISNKIIRSLNMDYDPSEYIKDENEELTIKEWIKKYRSIVPDGDIIWLLCRKEFMSEKDLILFGVWCAREALKLIENPDKRNIEACNVAEKYANGEVTKDELDAAHDAVSAAAREAYYASDSIAYYTALSVAYATSSIYCATRAASAATNAVLVTYCVAHDNVNAARNAQLEQLLTYFE
jgi:hypothetical protein